MTALRRAFLAAVPPDEVLDVIAEMASPRPRSGFRSGFRLPSRSPLRWTLRAQWHVTIQYFGKVADLDDLVGSLAGAIAGVPAALVQLQGAGGFPSARNASVYWLGVADPEPLTLLHAAVMASADRFVRTRDETSYKPHLTLARLQSRKNLSQDVEALDGYPIGPAWLVEEVVLMESEPQTGGAVYHQIARFPLG